MCVAASAAPTESPCASRAARRLLPISDIPATLAVAVGSTVIHCARTGPAATADTIDLRVRRLARDLSVAAEPAAAGGGPHDGRPAARDRGRRLREDARAHVPGRAPALDAGSEAAGDPRDHVHEQGRERDEGTARAADRWRRA